MITKFLNKYLSIIFVLTTFMGGFHHHQDSQTHDNCQICVVQSNIFDMDIPLETVYFTKLDLFTQAVYTNFTTQRTNKEQNTLNARAPPKIS